MVILYPDLSSTKPRARSGQVKKVKNKKASTILCSVVKHAGSSYSTKEQLGKPRPSGVFFPSYVLLPFPACFSTKQSTVSRLLYLFHDKESVKFPMHHFLISKETFGR